MPAPALDDAFPEIVLSLTVRVPSGLEMPPPSPPDPSAMVRSSMVTAASSMTMTVPFPVPFRIAGDPAGASAPEMVTGTLIDTWSSMVPETSMVALGPACVSA